MRLLKWSWVPLSFSPHIKAKGYCAHIFVSLMQSLRYMLWMEKCTMTFSLESESEFHMY